MILRRRSAQRRLERLLQQLDDDGAGSGGGDLEVLVGRLERRVDQLLLRLADAERSVGLALGALESTPGGVVLWDEDGRELRRNEMASAFASARHGDALVEQAIEEELRAALVGSTRRRTVELLGPPPRSLVITAAPVDDGTRLLGAVAVVDDVSERRRLEAIRRDFVANISHELRTPVGAMGLLAETLAAEEDAAVARRLADRMSKEAMRVGRIIDDLMALSRIEAEEQPMREPVRLLDVVAEAADRVRSLAESRRIALRTSGVGERHSVRGDRRQLVSAVTNLLENACKYSDPDSEVVVSSCTSNGSVALAVADRGIGIPAADLERVFERFYRVDRARSRDTGGTGLGLAIVRHVAGNHRGHVSVESEEGVGSTFTLTLPSGPSPLSPQMAPQEET